jgi:hypothetical protein
MKTTKICKGVASEKRLGGRAGMVSPESEARRATSEAESRAANQLQGWFDRVFSEATPLQIPNYSGDFFYHLLEHFHKIF